METVASFSALVEQCANFKWTNSEFFKLHLCFAFSFWILAGSLNPNMTPKSWSHFTTLTWSGARPVYHMITSRFRTCVTCPRLGQRTWDHQTSLMDTAVTWWPLLSRPVVGKLEWSLDQTILWQGRDLMPPTWFFVAYVSCRLLLKNLFTDLRSSITVFWVFLGQVQNYF